MITASYIWLLRWAPPAQRSQFSWLVALTCPWSQCAPLSRLPVPCEGANHTGPAATPVGRFACPRRRARPPRPRPLHAHFHCRWPRRPRGARSVSVPNQNGWGYVDRSGTIRVFMTCSLVCPQFSHAQTVTRRLPSTHRAPRAARLHPLPARPMPCLLRLSLCPARRSPPPPSPFLCSLLSQNGASPAFPRSIQNRAMEDAGTTGTERTLRTPPCLFALPFHPSFLHPPPQQYVRGHSVRVRHPSGAGRHRLARRRGDPGSPLRAGRARPRHDRARPPLCTPLQVRRQCVTGWQEGKPHATPPRALADLWVMLACRREKGATSSACCSHPWHNAASSSPPPSLPSCAALFVQTSTSTSSLPSPTGYLLEGAPELEVASCLAPSAAA